MRAVLVWCTVLLTTANGLSSGSGSLPSVPSSSVPYKDGAATVIPLNEHGTQELFDRWVSQAVSGLFSAVAQRHIESVDDFEKELLHNCSKIAETVPQHAKCVARLIKAADGRIIKDVPTSHIKHKVQKGLQRKVISLRGHDEQDDSEVQWEGAFGLARSKRDTGYQVSRRDSYSLSHSYDETPFQQVAKYLTDSVRALKHKGRTETWQETMVKIRKTAEEEKAADESKKAMMRRLRTFIDNTPTKLEDPMKNDALEKLEKEMARKEAATDESKAPEEVRVPMKVLREAVKLGMELSGQNVHGFDNKTLRLVSPRFFSVVKDEAEEDMVNLLSPSLFSLHEEGTQTEKLLSLPHLLKGLTKKDQQAWMDFIVEASGVSDAVNKASDARKKEKDAKMRSPEGAPLFFTKKNLTEKFGPEEVRKVDLFESVAKKYSNKQKSALDQQGYAFMTEEQVEMMYGKDSPYHDADRLVKYKEFSMLDEDTRQHMLKHEIVEVATKARRVSAQPVAQLAKRRSKRAIVNSPFLFTPLIDVSAALSNTWIVQSPIVFSPIIVSPAALGPIILSPWVFIPLIVSPRVMGPLILSPMIFSPIILSPLCLHPLVLSPGIFNPFILSPFVLSPFILSPQVFTPMILSPFALSPLILTPMVGSPLILSPFVLSPLILSPQALFAVVLSPYALSPLVESKLIAAEVVLSPSVLS